MEKTTSYQVIKVFRDKDTKKRYIPGDSFKSKDPDRIAELQADGYLASNEQIKEQPGETNGKKKENDPGSPDNPAQEVKPDADDAR